MIAASNLIDSIVYALKAPWRSFMRWVDVTYLRATIAGLEDDLRILRGIQGYRAKSEQLIVEEIEAAKHLLHLATRKGGV